MNIFCAGKTAKKKNNMFLKIHLQNKNLKNPPRLWGGMREALTHISRTGDPSGGGGKCTRSTIRPDSRKNGGGCTQKSGENAAPNLIMKMYGKHMSYMAPSIHLITYVCIGQWWFGNESLVYVHIRTIRISFYMQFSLVFSLVIKSSYKLKKKSKYININDSSSSW